MPVIQFYETDGFEDLLLETTRQIAWSTLDDLRAKLPGLNQVPVGMMDEDYNDLPESVQMDELLSGTADAPTMACWSSYDQIACNGRGSLLTAMSLEELQERLHVDFMNS